MNLAQQLADYRSTPVAPWKPEPSEPPALAAVRASVPNHFQIIKDVANAGHYDLSTKMGCGIFTEDATAKLAAVDPNWGDLLKNPGQNQWNTHAVDNPLYLSSVPGQSTAVDIIGASESVAATLQWSPDVPRYSAANWKKRTTGSRFVLPPHNTKLVVALFWLLAGFRKDRAKLKAFTDRVRDKYKGDAVRAFLTVGGDKFQAPDGTLQDPWLIAGSFFNESGHFENAREAINWLFDQGLTVCLDLVGSGAQAATQQQRFAICDRACQLVETCGPHKFRLLNMWNEYYVTGGQIPWLREMVDRVYRRLGHAVQLAMDTPSTIMQTPTSDADYERIQREIAAEMAAFYPDGFVAANAITPQYSRDLPNPIDMGPRTPPKRHSYEPRGVGTSGQSVDDDPLPLVHDYCQAAMTGHDTYGFVPLPGIWGGMCNGWPNQNRWPMLDSIPNHEGHEVALSSVRSGVYPIVPKPGTAPPTPIPPKPTWQLLAGEVLERAKTPSLISSNGKFQAVLQGADANFVVYHRHADGSLGAVVWSANTHTRPELEFLAMLANGNVAGLDIRRDGLCPPVRTRTSYHPGAKLQLNDDGVLVVYNAPGLTPEILWASVDHPEGLV